MNSVRIVFQFISFALPWSIRKRVLSHFFGFELQRGSRIGYSIILARSVILHEGAKIQNGNFINSIDKLELMDYAKIGSFNWITGASIKSSAYQATPDRECKFRLGKHTRITDRHYFDCNGGISIGAYTTIAGLGSQFISHGINVMLNQQEAHPISIGDYCMLGSRVTVLKNSSLPHQSVLAAGAVLTKEFKEPRGIFAGIPAKRVKELSSDAKYFHRVEGSVS